MTTLVLLRDIFIQDSLQSCEFDGGTVFSV